MSRGTRRYLVTSHACGVLLLLLGCGEQVAPPVAAVTARPDAPATTPSAPGTSSAQPTAVTNATGATSTANPVTSQASTSASAMAAGESLPSEIPFAEEGSPEWRLYEITRLIAPPALRKEVRTAEGTAQQVDRTPQELAEERQKSLRQVIVHAGQVIAATHQDPAREPLFTNAVHYLSLAHLELALAGDAESARQLGAAAEAIYAAKPESVAAEESAGRMVELAQRMAERFGRQDPAWARAHATQARLFAERFPKSAARAASALLEAGRTCEAAGLTTEARDCYLLLAERFGDTPHADAIAPHLRRLQLTGKQLVAADLGGPTIDGGFLSIEQLRGRHVLVVFWASDSSTFEADFPRLQRLQEEHGDRLAIVGVNLDVDEGAVDRFLESHPLQWRQIFDPDPSQRGIRNVVARHYGVTAVPLYWLIDPTGKVTAAPADLGQVRLATP